MGSVFLNSLLTGIAFLVGLRIKIDEKQKVARQQSASKVSSVLRSTAITKGGKGRVGKGEVGVSAKVDDKQIDNELDNLHGLLKCILLLVMTSG